ncbi:hypothetical protein ACLOJK_014157 [Asimina triloba]
MDSKDDGTGKPSALDTAADGEGKEAASVSRQSMALEGLDSGNGQTSVPASPDDAKGKGAGSLSGKPVPASDNPPIRYVPPFAIDIGDDGQWEVFGKKSKNQISWGASAQQKGTLAASSLNARQDTPRKGPVDWKRNAGGGNLRPLPPARAWESSYMAPPPFIPPPLQHGWQWASRAGSSNKAAQGNASENVQNEQNTASKFLPQHGGGSASETAGQPPDQVSKEDDDDDELLDDSDGDPLSDDYDSDTTQKSHETRKNNKWFKGFFEVLDKLTVEEINDASRQWHCPACHDGPGAIDWYKGLQPLMAHAKTKGARRVRLHRELAELLDEELQRRGTSVIPAGEAFGKWKGLREAAPDHLIVWPPMVIIMNTLLDKDEDEKWVGMGNQELLEYFKEYDAVKARQSYGPRGHRGIGVLIFEATALGYMEAARLHKHFIKQGTDREAWERRRVLLYPGGKRQLYGFMASKEDMDNFNLHSQGKSRLKFEMRSYQETVVSQMKQVSEDNQRLNYLENKVAKQKALANTMGVICEKLRIANLENKIVRQRSKAYYEENKEEMDNMERFFKEKMDAIHRSLEEKETTFEKLLQKDRERAQQSTTSFGSRTEDNLSIGVLGPEILKSTQQVGLLFSCQDTSSHRRSIPNFSTQQTNIVGLTCWIYDQESPISNFFTAIPNFWLEEIARFIDSQTKGIEEFEAEREMLIKIHEDKKTELRRRYLEEEVELEKEFDARLTQLMAKCQDHSSELSTSS